MVKLKASLTEGLFDIEARIQRAVFCTYRFDPAYFGDAIWPELRRRGCERALVLMDATQYEALPAPGNLGTAGRVVLERFPAGRLFHPKVFIVAGGSRARCVIGSANLTQDGLERNHELFSLVSESDHDLSRLIEWLDLLSSQRALGASARKILHETSAELRAAQPNRPGCLPLPLVWTGLNSLSLWKQLEAAMHGKPPQKAIILSPYFEAPDRFDHGLLATWLKQGAHVDIYVSRDRTQSRVPRDELAALSKRYPKRLSLYGLSTQGRLLHGKLIGVMSGSRAWLLAGSPNFTTAALTGKNLEAGLLFALRRAEAERYLQRLLVDSRPLKPSDLPAPVSDPPPRRAKKSGFVLSAILRVQNDCLILHLNCPWRELSTEPGNVILTIGGQPIRLTPAMLESEQTILVRPASTYLRDDEKKWQTGSVTLRTEDNLAEDWRLIELAEGEALDEEGTMPELPDDLATFVARLLNPRSAGASLRHVAGRAETGIQEASPAFEDVEGGLDYIYRLSAGLGAHMAWVMTDPYTVHRWRANWLRLHEIFSRNQEGHKPIERAFLAARLLNRLEVCLAQDVTQSQHWLAEDHAFRASLYTFLEVAKGSPELKVSIITQCLSASRV